MWVRASEWHQGRFDHGTESRSLGVVLLLQVPLPQVLTPQVPRDVMRKDMLLPTRMLVQP